MICSRDFISCSLRLSFSHTHQTEECDTLVLPHSVPPSRCHPTTVAVKTLSLSFTSKSQSQDVSDYHLKIQEIITFVDHLTALRG